MQEMPATISGLAIGTMPGNILCVTAVFDEPDIRVLSREDVTAVWLARLIDRNSVMFLDRFQTILDAYRTGAMDYGCLIAFKPQSPGD